VLASVAAQVGIAVEQARLVRAAADADELRQADRVRAALLAAVSHDLRTPLAAAKAAVTGLADVGVTWTAVEQAELLETATGSLEDLQALIDDLLDLSRLEAGVMPVALVAVGLDDVVPRALDVVAGSAPVVLDVAGTLPAVLADPGLLERVVANLVQNALRHAGTGGPPEIVARRSDQGVVLEVRDHGPGIAPQAWERAFAPFHRLGDGTAATGTGLGLAIARGFVESMGGVLTPSATPGGGLTMSVTLPAVPGSDGTPDTDWETA
jgi:two-component system sensor histidine kinase KdpD